MKPRYTHPHTSTPQEHVPEPLQPVPDRAAGPVFPYRGQQTHGVAPTGQWEDVPVQETVDVEYPPREPEQVPVPVRIVTDDHAEQVRRMRISRTYAGTLKSDMVAPLNRARINLKIRNLDAVRTVYILDEPNSNAAQNGYPVPPLTEWTSVTQWEVYAEVDDGATLVALAVQQDFSTDV
jgi:hypothetical protein